MATKVGRMIASLNGLLPIMSFDPFITWPCEIRGSRIGGGSAHKRLSRHRLIVIILPTDRPEIFLPIARTTKNSFAFAKHKNKTVS